MNGSLTDKDVIGRGIPWWSVAKNLPAREEDIGIADLIPGSERPLEEEMATLFCILLGKVLWEEDPGRQQAGYKELDVAEYTRMTGKCWLQL